MEASEAPRLRRREVVRIAMENIDPAKIEDYHAHIYYDAGSRETAAQIRESIEKNFTVEMGRWHDEPIGPRPHAMYQVKFAVPEFNRIVPWLMLNRRGLNILVHRIPAMH